MKRLVVVGGATVVVCVLLVVAAIAALLVRDIGRSHQAEQQRVSCPPTMPSACSEQLANAWRVDAASVPTIAVPAALHYDGGNLSKADHPESAYFNFHLVKPDRFSPAYLHVMLIVTPGAPPSNLKHHRTVQLPDGRSYLDFTPAVGDSGAIGPFLEQVGGFTVQTSPVFTRTPSPVMQGATLALMLSTVVRPTTTANRHGQKFCLTDLGDATTPPSSVCKTYYSP